MKNGKLLQIYKCKVILKYSKLIENLIIKA